MPVDGKVKLEAIDLKTGDKTKTLSNVTIDNYTYSGDGRMMVTGSYSEGKAASSSFIDGVEIKNTSTENKKMKTIVSKETESRIAKMLNTTTDEL